MSQKIFSVDEDEVYQVWLSKIKLTLKTYQKLGTRILLPPSMADTNQIDQITGSVNLTKDQAINATRKNSKKVNATPVGRLTTKLGI